VAQARLVTRLCLVTRCKRGSASSSGQAGPPSGQAGPPNYLL